MLSPLRGGRVFEKIVGHVRDGILAGRLKPGDRLPPERELVRQFHVGRGAIRVAFRILKQSALIRIRTGKGGGAFVAGRHTAAVTRALSDLLRFGGPAVVGRQPDGGVGATAQPWRPSTMRFVHQL